MVVDLCSDLIHNLDKKNSYCIMNPDKNGPADPFVYVFNIRFKQHVVLELTADIQLIGALTSMRRNLN